jgi:hypothetical protein
VYSEEDCIEDSKEGCTKNSIECVLKVVASVLRGLRAGYTNICRACTEGSIECILKVA